jgi:hypothetical protein
MAMMVAEENITRPLYNNAGADCNSKSSPIEDEPEREVGFQHKMSLGKWHAED